MNNLADKKKYYSINEVVDKVNLSLNAIRSLERKHQQINPTVIRGRRYYREADISLIKSLINNDSLYKNLSILKSETVILTQINRITVLLSKLCALNDYIKFPNN